jgi:hypothetical protein
MKSFYQPYSVPGAVVQNGLEVRLHSLLSKDPRLSSRGSAFLLTLSLGVTLPVLAVRPTLRALRNADQVAQADETVTLPSGITAKMRAVYLSSNQPPTRFWDINGQPLDSKEYEALGSDGIIGEPKRYVGVMEVRFPRGVDVSVTGAPGNYGFFGNIPPAPAEEGLFIHSPETRVGIASGTWKTLTRFSPKGKRLSGSFQVSLKRSVARPGFLEVTDTLPRANLRLVALLKDGTRRVFAFKHYQGHVSPPENTTYYKPESSLPVQEWLYETRSYTWIRFEGWKAPKGVTP